MTDQKRFSLVKPNLDTPFHIDFEWWKQHDNNWHIYLNSCLCQSHQELFSNVDENVLIDRVDPETGEVHSVDGLQDVLMSHCVKQPDFITEHTAMIDAIFRVFLAQGNDPLSSKQLAELVKRPGDIILRTLSGQVYKGIRPCKT